MTVRRFARSLILLLLLLVGLWSVGLWLAGCAPSAQTTAPQTYVASVSSAVQQVVATTEGLEPAGLGAYRITDIDTNQRASQSIVSARYRQGGDVYHLRATIRAVGDQRVLISIRSEITDLDAEPFATSPPTDPATVDLFPAQPAEDADAVRYLYDRLAERLLLSS